MLRNWVVEAVCKTDSYESQVRELIRNAATADDARAEFLKKHAGESVEVISVKELLED